MGEVIDQAAAAAAAEADARTERIERVSMLHAEITAGMRAFLRAVYVCDQHRDWHAAGFGSCAEWLTWLLGIKRNAANESVRAARALEHLPLTSEAMARGAISFTKVKALTRVATADNERELLELARAGSAAKLERVVRAWKALDRDEELELEQVRHASRRLSIVPDNDGMYVVRGRLSAEVGALLMRAIDAAGDALFAEEQREVEDTEQAGGDVRVGCREGVRGPADATPGGSGGATREEPGVAPPLSYTPPECEGAEDRRRAARRRADAIGLIAERALSAGFSGPDAPISGSRAERYQVVLHVEAPTLTEDEEPGRSELEDGTRVSAETARRLACDASVVEVKHGGAHEAGSSRSADDSAAASCGRTGVAGAVLGAGRRTRTVPSSTRRALDARDRGCRFPACHRRFTDAHHIEHWGDGGETTLNNLVLLCPRHHRAVHEGGFRVFSDVNGEVVFFTPDGRAFTDAPPRPRLEEKGAGALIRRNRERGTEVSPRGAMPRYSRDGYIPWAIEVAAREALDPPELAG